MEVKDNIESDHHLLIVRLNMGQENEVGKRRRKGKKGRWKRGTWKGREWFKNWVKNLEIKKGNVEEKIKVMRDELKSALEEMGEKQRSDTRKRKYG